MAYTLTWITSQLAVGSAPMSYEDLEAITEQGINAIVNLCGEDSTTNYCHFRFAGGGADFSGRLLRLDFIRTLLKDAGFQVETRGDLLDARVSALSSPEMQVHLTTLGRLLGATKLMDMTLHDTQDVQHSLQDFLAGTSK